MRKSQQPVNSLAGHTHHLKSHADVYAGWDAKEAGAAREAAWNEKFTAYSAAHPELAAEYERRVLKGELPADFEEKAQAFVQASQDKAEGIASRKALTKCHRCFRCYVT